ncbi:aminoglycoside phosphotransferase family protein [Bradyrhizobium sp. LHD-71]|uniref:phosphotransferase family protein n=1 Tax=Bradyrhizobium sp. LHD-71 TaxID=3072141 RepID=UPI00280DAC16|nr:aminoglycoside phosphotransferase family protein [Bradyrhizobium sp. LHD-71]MDQ8728605.1 aminoglycoside phosphotransferase family protein [Bradyrhizobium sp. LHD-71]
MADLVGSHAAAITRACPELHAAPFRLLAEGWDSTAVEVDGRLIFKFPKSEAAEKALLREASLLAVVRPHVSMPVPEMRIHHGPPVFSCHTKLHGEHLLTEGYHRLPETARDRLGVALGGFYAEIHRLERERMTAAGARPIDAWQSPQAVRTKALPKLDLDLRDYAEGIVSAFERLPPDPCGTTYGFFDGHGWNMAFDHDRARLNGIYDFADSGLGPLHQEFIYTNFISPDLTRRVIDAYEASSGRKLDRPRISILTGFHRLSELAALADDPQHVPAMIGHVAAWAAAAE